jgi:hypothetical protein
VKILNDKAPYHVLVSYYSQVSARNCLRELSGHETIVDEEQSSFVHKITCSAHRTNQRQLEYVDHGLPLLKCVELANYYLSFNGWHDRIITIHKLDLVKAEDEGISTSMSAGQRDVTAHSLMLDPAGKPSPVFEYGVEVTIALTVPPWIDHHSPTIASGNAIGKAESIHGAKSAAIKHALAEARKAAFSQLVVVVDHADDRLVPRGRRCMVKVREVKALERVLVPL